MPEYRYFVVREPKPPLRPTWHIIASVAADRVHSVCGKSKPHPARAVEALPYHDKSCESCLRLQAMDAEAK